MPVERDGVHQYRVQELQQILDDGSATVIDVRTQEEFGQGHIPGIANRPMQELGNWFKELSPDKSYVFVCRSGSRSQRVAMTLRQNGFSQVGNFVGGMLSWTGPVER